MPTTISGNDGVSQIQNNTITQADLTTAILPLGVGQTWVNATSIRALNTVYINDTGRPIQVCISASTSNTSGVTGFNVGGVVVFNTGWGAITSGNLPVTMSAVVPAGSSYQYTGNINFTHWAELR